MNRTLNVVRMQLVNRQTYIWVPLLVLTGSFVLTLAVYAILRNAGVTGPLYGGGAQAPQWYFLVVGVQALTLSFPFSQAMSVSRREFYLGTLLTAVMTAVIFSAIFVVGGVVEDLSGGWGMDGHFFRLPWVWEAGWPVAALFYFFLTLVFFLTGFWAATIYKRFGTLVLTAVLVAIGVVFVGVLWLIGQADAWVEMFVWFGEQGPAGLSLWGLVVAVVLAGISFLTLRRATP